MKQEKICTKCKKLLPIDDFYKCGLYRRGDCKECSKLINKEIYYKNHDNRLAQVNAYHQKNKSKYYERTYGITLDELNTLLEKQGSKCAICGTHQENLSQTLSVDHCHTTGSVRGLLCQPCNFMLGNAQDSPSVLRKGIEYLVRYSTHDSLQTPPHE